MGQSHSAYKGPGIINIARMVGSPLRMDALTDMHLLPQVMLESSVYLSLAVYSGCCLLAALASCFLPIETKGRGLQESSHREWGQEMVGRGTHGTGVARSNSGSQEQ